MNKTLLFVGLEVDDKNFHIAASSESTEIIEFQTRPRLDSLVSKLQELADKGYELNVCYEASYLGFSLCRDLRKKGFNCEIVAPSLIPQTPGPKVKTDRLDAKKLARFYQTGLLTIIHVPTEVEESDRDLVRTRDFLASQIRALKLHILSHCRRRGWNYRQDAGQGSNFWTKAHRAWLDHKIALEVIASTKTSFKVLLTQMIQMEQQLVSIDFEIESLAETEKYSKRVDALVCFRGIKTLTAMVYITEIGDVARFSSPLKLVSYLGLDISEYSSGANQRRYHITKMGNVYARTALIEAAQHVGLPPKISRDLRDRRKNADHKFIEIADRGMNRLHKRYQHLIHRGKPSNVAKVACAREMIGFIWESLKAAA